MKLSGIAKVSVYLTSLACIFFCASPLHSQQSDDVDTQTTTQERIDTEVWWPTMSSLPLEAFAGSEACTRCHADETARQPSTSMHRAAALASDATFLRNTPSLAFSSPPFTYSLASTAAGIEYSVSNGSQSLSRKLDWVMGAGDLGLTFLYQMDDHWYQSEISFYTAPSILDITTGLSRDPGADLADLTAALGQRLSPEETRRCFNCHSVHSTTSQGFNPLHAVPGIGCESCHGPGRAHADQMTAAAKAVDSRAHAVLSNTSNIFNPAKLSPVDINDFCGACHRTFDDATLSTSQAQATDTAVVRFQPYRLEESKCWRATLDERLTCVACHNPHEPLNRNLASYDRHCLQCHTAVTAGPAPAHAAKVCPKATSQCVTCHMPKVAVASMHGEFTDHYIRVVRPGEGFPR